MPYKLNTLIKKIEFIPNPSNRKIVNEFLDYMKEKGKMVNEFWRFGNSRVCKNQDKENNEGKEYN